MTPENEKFVKAADALHLMACSIGIDKVNFENLEDSVRTFDAGKAMTVAWDLSTVKEQLFANDEINNLIKSADTFISRVTNSTRRVNNFAELRALLGEMCTVWENYSNAQVQATTAFQTAAQLQDQLSIVSHERDTQTALVTQLREQVTDLKEQINRLLNTNPNP